MPKATSAGRCRGSRGHEFISRARRVGGLDAILSGTGPGHLPSTSRLFGLIFTTSSLSSCDAQVNPASSALRGYWKLICTVTDTDWPPLIVGAGGEGGTPVR